MQKSGLLTSAKHVCSIYEIFIQQSGSDPLAAQATLLELHKAINTLREEVGKGEALVEQFGQLTKDLSNLKPEPLNTAKTQNADNPLAKLYSLANSPEKLTEALTKEYFPGLQNAKTKKG